MQVNRAKKTKEVNEWHPLTALPHTLLHVHMLPSQTTSWTLANKGVARGGGPGVPVTPPLGDFLLF